MTRPKPETSKTHSQARDRRVERLWLACFQYDEPCLPGAARSHGSFQLVVKATTPKKALDLCKERLRELRTKTSLFDTPCSIYLDHLIAIENVGATPALVNWVAKLPAKGGAEAELLCGLPEQAELDVEVFGPNDEADEEVSPFLDFGGMRATELLAQAVQAGTPALPSVSAPRPGKPRSR